MKDFDSKKLDAMLASGQLDEAKSYIRSVFAGEGKPTERADAAIDYALAYLKLSNKINRSYADSLAKAGDLLEQAKAVESRSEDSLKVARVRQSLNS